MNIHRLIMAVGLALAGMASMSNAVEPEKTDTKVIAVDQDSGLVIFANGLRAVAMTSQSESTESSRPQKLRLTDSPTKTVDVRYRARST